MADLPATTATDGPQMITPESVPGSDFLRGALGMPLTRQVLLLVALAGSVALGVSSVLWMQSPEYRPLANISSAYQAQEVTSVLDGSAIDYRVDQQTGMILVSQSDLHRARMQLAGAEVLDERQMGYELLDREQGFGVSQAMEKVQRQRSLEGELAKSIATISAVHSARVLLAQPNRTAFVRDRRKATASVTVTVAVGRRLDREQIRGIANLVAGAVPELDAGDVAVVDQSGKLLSREESDPALQQSSFQLEYVAKLEDKLRRKVNNILSPSLGMTGFSAEVAVDIDFTRTEQTEELYNPDLTAVRSEAAINEETNADEGLARGIPGALSNDPAVTEAEPETAQGTAPRRSRSEVTKNYEVDRTISHTRLASGIVNRVSVSVIVDDKPPVVDAEAEEGADAAQAPWSAEELERLAALVRNAVGFDAARGDAVTIVNRPFMAPVQAEIAPVPIWQQEWFGDLAKQLLGGIALLLVILGLLRPLYRNLSQAGAVVKEQHTMAMAQLAQQEQGAGALATAGALSGASIAGLLPPGSNGADVSSKLDTVRGIVSEDPERAAQVVKHWVSNDE
ncbi:MAG: flagellar basal-body MS-ring/collar protein FliF [Pseudomonadales bacterium]